MVKWRETDAVRIDRLMPAEAQWIERTPHGVRKAVQLGPAGQGRDGFPAPGLVRLPLTGNPGKLVLRRGNGPGY